MTAYTLHSTQSSGNCYKPRLLMHQLGISFRPLQASALGLDPEAALEALLVYPFQLIRLGAYWNRLEPEPGRFQPEELDRQLDAAEQAGKQVIMCVGPVKPEANGETTPPAIGKLLTVPAFQLEA